MVKPAEEIEQLKATVAELQELIIGNGNYDKFKLPDPVRNMSDFTGNKKELAAWLEELDELYDMYIVKGSKDEPDYFPAHYMRAIKNKIKGDARTVLCANGNPNTIPGIKMILIENYGDQRDLATNLSHLFHMKRGERNNLKFYSDMKELSSKIKTNLNLNPVKINDLIEMIIITKYLDNIGEPLASIIRQSKPATLEQAYQAVCINQNAEARNRPAHSSKPRYKENNTNNNNYSSKQESSSYTKPVKKYPVQQQNKYRAKAEIHNNEMEAEREKDDPEVNDHDSDHDDDDDDYDNVETETNFQSVRLTQQLT